MCSQIGNRCEWDSFDDSYSYYVISNAESVASENIRELILYFSTCVILHDPFKSTYLLHFPIFKIFIDSITYLHLKLE